MRNLIFSGLLAAAAVTAIASSPASAAPAYAYCMQSQAYGSQCNFPTFESCQATASGLGYDCIQNPALAARAQIYSEPRTRSRRSYAY